LGVKSAEQVNSKLTAEALRLSELARELVRLNRRAGLIVYAMKFDLDSGAAVNMFT
jgi:hypothetical protein